MKNKPILSFLCLFGLALIIGSCDKNFDEVNRNPNQPENVTPDLLLPNIIRGSVNTWANLGWNYGNLVMQYSSKIQFTSEDRYEWGPQSTPWNTYYSLLRDVKNIELLSAAGEQNNYLGVALVLKSWMYHVLTDCYGDIPYSEAIKGKSDAIYFPVYDPQEKVYEGILEDLKRANDLLGSSSEAVRGDILFEGNILKWKKLANSLRLRILLRLSKRIDPSAAMREILSDPTANPVFQSNQDQAALQYLPTAPNQWTLYTTRSGSYDEIRMSTTIEQALKRLDDPRLGVYFQPTTNSGAGTAGEEGDYAGVPNGLNDEEALQYSPSGDPTKGGSNYISRVGLMFACLACDPLASPTAAQGIIMTYAELQFILAEAAERGYISGDPGAYYLNGIRASFDYYTTRVPANYGIQVTPPDSYFTQAEVEYTGDTQAKLRKIATQKWLALFFNGLESWFDWKRTGIPEIIPGPGNVNNDRVPRRFIYPTSEQLLNDGAYHQAVQRQGTDDMNTRVWWDAQ